MAKNKGWPKDVNSFCSICKTEAKEIPFITIYSNECPKELWKEYCKAVEEDPSCTALRIYIAGVKKMDTEN